MARSNEELQPLPERDQFSELAVKLFDFMDHHPEYYAVPNPVTGDAPSVVVARDLMAAKEAFEKNEIPPGGERVVNLFHGYQTRNVMRETERKNSDLVAGLYVMFSGLSGYRATSYHDIEADINDLVAQRLVFAETSDFKYFMRGQRLALESDGVPVGIQLGLSDNIFATFKLGNLGRPEQVGDYTLVDLRVARPPEHS